MMDDAMQISLEDVQNETDSYQFFLDSLKAKDTLRKYKSSLGHFLNAIPTSVFLETEKAKSSDVSTLAKLFVNLARKDPELAKKIITAYVKQMRKLVEEDKMSANTLPNYVKPIKAFLEINGVAIHWKSVYKLYPRASPEADDRAYTREEIQRMLEVCNDVTDKVIVLMSSSGGFRVESWNFFKWKDVVFFKNSDGSFKGAALLVYRGDPEHYWTFITPESCKMLELYKELWKSQTGKYPMPDDPLLKITKQRKIIRLEAPGVKRRLDKIVRKIGLRTSLPNGKRRYEVQLSHGFRKYFNTMMRRAGVNFLDKEDMMGHSVGLERHYERYSEEDFERFSEYQKAIPYLTISNEERLRLKNNQLEDEKSTLERINDEKTKLIEEYQKLEARTRRLEKIHSK